MKEILGKTFLFSGIETEEISSLLRDVSFEEVGFARGELIYSSSSADSKIGFILSGRCEVRHLKGDSASAVLNVLGEGEAFGVLSVLSEKEFPTHIFATKNSTILFLKKEDLLKIVNNNSQIAINLINFLANRISFLNEKIATFSGTRVENRLASHLISESKRNASTSFVFNCKKCSEAINAGRASVYRALASLEADGLITVADKKINIIDLDGLERISK
ncbi:MAG: Crp/Fnr family transcriptional regulator [Ruminococcaceae bacterium]|nr:Crp/Fnr family transcriptional regulator [Oscillospiraceae bacterium]